ncbi:MAG: hypothetical protein IMF07_04435 [Proteobacteria bacterium]|nr:hypothetical protein [Pseudomonadota bacterium]
MDSAVSQEERLLFEKLKSIRELISQVHPEARPKVDKLYIREILYNHLSQKNLSPQAAEFDALADDIEGYINRSFAAFIALFNK